MKRFIIFLIAFIAIPVCVYAQETNDYEEYLSGYDFSFFKEELGNETYDFLKEIGVEDFDFNSISSLSFEDSLNILKEIISGKIKSPMKSAVSILAFILLSSLFRSIKADSSEDLNGVYSTCSALIISVILVAQMSPAISLASSSIKLAGNFIFAFVPVFCAIVASSGGITTSFSTNSMLMILSQGLTFISANVFTPLANCFLAIGICSSLRSELNLGGLISTMKKWITSLISVISALFVSILSIKTNVSARADMLGIRSVRFVINSVVPIIGGSISEGLLSIQNYSSLIKSSVGIVGIIAIALVFLPAIIEISLWRFMLSVCSLVSEMFGDNNVSDAINAFKETSLIINVVLILSMVTTVISFGILIATRSS
ncbi:MAG: hypothetical protein IJR70_08390 [Eubacterium sp.]|nr:hypothetical protein [Eubacterium sp.]